MLFVLIVIGLTPRITWLNTVQRDLRAYNLTLNEAVDLAQNRPLCRLMSIRMALRTPSGACQQRRSRPPTIDHYGVVGAPEKNIQAITFM